MLTNYNIVIHQRKRKTAVLHGEKNMKAEILLSLCSFEPAKVQYVHMEFFGDPSIILLSSATMHLFPVARKFGHHKRTEIASRAIQLLAWISPAAGIVLQLDL